jgi:hypothetical protein
MGDLVKFLRARLDEDEQTAREAGNRRWLVQDNMIELWPEREDDGFMSWPTRADARHAARHDPARVLAEVEAKRRIIAEHHPVDPCDAHDASFDTIPCDTLLALASVYAEHPDYREEWKPDA